MDFNLFNIKYRFQRGINDFWYFAVFYYIVQFARSETSAYDLNLHYFLAHALCFFKTTELDDSTKTSTFLVMKKTLCIFYKKMEWDPISRYKNWL